MAPLCCRSIRVLSRDSDPSLISAGPIMRQTLFCHTLAVVVLSFACSASFGQFGYFSGAQQYMQRSQGQSRASTTPSRRGQPEMSPRASRRRALAKAELERANGAPVERHALIVAIREYPDSTQLASLPGTNQDAHRLAGVLRRGGFDEEDVVVVCDDASTPELQPTRENIDRELRKIVQGKNEDSLVAIFLTCHGLSLADESYICPSDASDAALSDPEKAAQQLISVKDIATRLSEQCKAPMRLLVVDACRDTSNDRTAGYVKNVEALEKPAEGLWLMSSCSEGQYSWMSDQIREGERHALFSHFIAKGLEGDADLLGNNDGEVNLFELYTYTFVKTQEAAAEIEEHQTPELFGLASPFCLARTSSFITRRKLTTSDPQLEAARSAEQLAEDVVLNLRLADLEYRDTVSAPKVNEETVTKSSQVLHRYLCHLLGNRVRTALELDEDCRLAWVAKGLCYRTCGLYEDAFSAFQQGGEHFSLFVKAQPDSIKRYVAYDRRKNRIWRDRDGNPVPRIQKSQEGALGYVGLFEHPGDEEPKYSVERQKKVRISKIQDPWLYVDAIDDQEIVEGGWIHRDEVHWFPEAIDLYTPTSPMRSWGGGMAANRLDYAANGLAAQLGEPARAIEQLAVPFDNAANAVARAGAPISAANSILGYFGISIPNYPAVAAGYVNIPAGYIRTAASYARIPSNYVGTASGYASIPMQYAGLAQQWSGLANTYYSGHQREEKVEESRERLEDAGKLAPVEERPILILEIPLPKRRT